MSDATTQQPASLPPEVLSALIVEASDMFWFVHRSYATHASSYAKLPTETVESALAHDWLDGLARRLLPHPDVVASRRYKNIFRHAEEIEGVPVATALAALRGLNPSLRQRFFSRLRVAREDWSPTPFRDALDLLQKVQRRPYSVEHPLSRLLKDFPQPAHSQLTASTFLRLAENLSADERSALRSGLSALQPPTRGLFYRTLAVFHGVFADRPSYPALFSVVLQQFLHCSTDLERFLDGALLSTHPTDDRVELAVKAL